MSTIRQYIAWVEKRIARLVIQEGIHVGLLKVTQGPLTITFQVRLLEPSRTAVSRLLKLGDAIAEAIQVEAVRITRSASGFVIEIPSPLRRTPSCAELIQHSHGIQVCVGLDSLRQPVHVDLQQHGALLWVGPSRRGKTQSMKCALYCLAKQKVRFKFVILCHERKREDWQAFAAAAGCMGIVTSPTEQRHVLWWASMILLKMRTPFTFALVLDDLLNLLEEAPDISPHLAKLASLGAGLGVHLLAGTQEAGSKRGTGGEGVEANASAKILYKATSKARAARNAGQGEMDLAALTGAKGDAVLLIDGYATRIATGYADDRDIIQLPAGPQYAAPWRDYQTGTPELSSEAEASTPPSTTEVNVPISTSGTNGVLDNHTPLSCASSTACLAGQRTGSTPSTSSTPLLAEYKLTDQEPGATERNYLRTLYQRYGSKNQVLKTAWGGVVNQDGKTPKTWRWLQDALAEAVPDDSAHSAMQTEASVALSVGKLHIDMNTQEGQAVVESLIAQGLLPRDEITEVVAYQRTGG